MSGNNASYSQQIVDAALLKQVSKLSVESMWFDTTLQDITQDKSALTTFFLRSAIHEIECNVQTAYITIIRVIDESAVVLSILHLETHCNRFEGTQTFFYRVVIESHLTASSTTQSLVVLVGITCSGARNESSLQPGLTNTILYHRVACRIDDNLRILHQLKFLHTLLLEGREVLLMSSAQTSKDADCRLDDALQSHHFILLRDGCLEDTNLRVLVKSPHRKRHTRLRVIAARAAGNSKIRCQELIEPLLDDSLTITARNSYNGNIETRTMLSRKRLECKKGVLHEKEIGFREVSLHFFAHHKGSNASLIEVINIKMSVSHFSFDGKEER